jgi:hypothetical protein
MVISNLGLDSIIGFARICAARLLYHFALVSGGQLRQIPGIDSGDDIRCREIQKRGHILLPVVCTLPTVDGCHGSFREPGPIVGVDTSFWRMSDSYGHAV